jgi:hypothetical protein
VIDDRIRTIDVDASAETLHRIGTP